MPTRSRASWGIGDLADLARLGQWARRLGAGMLVVNPLDAVAPGLPQESSPYFPSSRRFLNPLYLSIDAVPGYDQLKGELASLAAEARALNAAALIDRDAVYRLKIAALEQLWRVFPPDDEFDRYVADQGEPLGQFAAYCTLVEKFGANWRVGRVLSRCPRPRGAGRDDRIGRPLPVFRLASVAVGSPVGCRHRTVDAAERSADRGQSRRLRRLGRAGLACAGRGHGGSARPVQHPRPELGPAAAGAAQVAGGTL